jgi:hypothetical protein
MDPAIRTWLLNVADITADLVDLLEAALCCEKEEFMKRIKSYHPVTMTLDGEDVTLHIRRMSTVEIQAFEDQMNKFGFNINAAKEGRTELPPDVNPQEVAQWLIDTISTNITLPPEQLVVENEDGTEKEIRTGADLIQQYGGRVDFLPTAVAFIWGENRLPEKHKIKYRTAAADAVNRMTGITDPEPALPEAVSTVAAAVVPSTEAEKVVKALPADMFTEPAVTH